MLLRHATRVRSIHLNCCEFSSICLVLKLEPGDADALQTKLFLLLQTEQYDASLALIEANDDKVSHEFERAYSLYRKQREPEAREVLDAIKAEKGDNDRGALHLEAQLVCFTVSLPS